MAVLKTLLPAQRHLILVRQSDSVCKKVGPGPQGFRVRREKEIAEEEAAAVWAVGPERFFSYPSTRPSALPFVLQVWVGVRSDQFYSFIVVRSACFVLPWCGEGGAHTLTCWRFVLHRGPCRRVRCSQSACPSPALGCRACLPPEGSAFWNSSVSVKLVSFVVNSILT